MSEYLLENFDESHWTGHPSGKTDVAILYLNTVATQLEHAGKPAFYRAVSKELLLNDSNLESLNAIEKVTFIGYPAGLYDSKNYLPIVRTGITATPIKIDFEGEPCFIIDANVYQGSSGSPVFIYDFGAYTTRQGDTVIGSRLILLGLIARNFHRTITSEIEEAETGHTAKFNEAIGLGVVYKASCIEECVSVFYARNSLIRL